MSHEKLYPAGRVLWIQNHVLFQVDDFEAVFGQVLFSKTMIHDHMPISYEKALESLKHIE
jgi:hypothetical protein